MLIAQLSDTHIRPLGQLYKDVVDSNTQFIASLTHIKELDCRPDLLLVTGDLTENGSEAEYHWLRELLVELAIPFLVIPGNHDNKEDLRKVFRADGYFPETGRLHYCVDNHALRIVAIDSCPSGLHHGAIDNSDLDWLQRTLEQDTVKPTIVMMHHPPFLSGIGYMDHYRFIDAEPLASIISHHDNIEAVLCGHVHRAMIKQWTNTVVIACPSTTTEIALQLSAGAKPQSFLGPPACMLHLWQPDHGLVSHVSYINKYPGPYPFF